MVCSLPAPKWNNPNRSGLLTATADTVLQQTTISWGAATAPSPVYYNLYWSDDPITLFDHPQGFAHDRLTAQIPFSVAPDGYYFGVRASRLGIAEDLDTLGNMDLNDTARIYPDSLVSLSEFSTITETPILEVDDTSGYPLTDGYLQIGDNIVLYSSIAVNGFQIADWDPFNCNDGYTYDAGTTISLYKGFEEGNSVLFQQISDCITAEPVWSDPLRPGAQYAENLGLGSVVKVSWLPATTPSGMSTTYYNVYANTSLDQLFGSPIGITESLNANVTELKSGDGYYFGVRATYFPADIDLASFEEISTDFYRYPESVLTDDYSSDSLAPLAVDSTAGFLSAGYLKVDDELLTYGSKTSTTFIISSRDSFGLGEAASHDSGATVKQYKGFEDLNSSFQFVTPTWGDEQPWLPPGTDPDMQDEDGYRAWNEDDLHEDHSDFESENSDFPSQDQFCGTYRANTTTLVNLYSGNLCGTYIGGREDGFGGGVRLTEATLRREETLLALTGEPFILLREKTTGAQCPRYSLHGEHANERCAICYGTRIYGGYDRYVSDRLYRPNIQNPNGMIAMRVSPYKNDLPMMGGRGLSQVDQLTLWLPSLPTIKKRDVVIRYLPFVAGEIPQEEFRYEVLDVERNRLLFGDDGKQSLNVRKLDKTHVLYTYPVDVVAPDAI